MERGKSGAPSRVQRPTYQLFDNRYFWPASNSPVNSPRPLGWTPQ